MEEKRKLKLFYKFLQKQMDKEEYEEFIYELGKKDAHKNFDHLFDAYADIIRKGKTHPQSVKKLSEDIDKILKTAKYKERIGIHKNNNFLHSPWLRIAAVILVVVSVTLIWNSVKRGQIDQTLTAINSKTLEKSTGFGELSKVILSDGSNVELNAGSLIRFTEKFSGQTREVRLNGQAYFNVARNENKPFIIKTGVLQVTVLGTSFDVKSFDDDDYAMVTVVSGQVKVNSPEEEFIITPNEQVYFQKSTGKLIKRKVEAENFVKWTKETLYFNQTPVKEMVRQLERWYNVKIVVNDSGLFSKTVTGEYTNEKLTFILKSLEFSLHIKYEIKGNEIILSKSI